MHNEINYIVIGAHKAGTTWLFSRFQELPEFSTLPVKELHYFDRSTQYPSPNYLSETSAWRRIWNRKWLSNAIRYLYINKRDYSIFKWYLKWFFSNYNDNWYLSLFKNQPGLTGDITPAYAILNEVDVARIHQLAPNAKIIYILRDPVERAWSHFKFALRNHSFDINQVSNQEVLELLNSDSQKSRSDYFSTIERFQKFYPNKQFLVTYYDKLEADPKSFLREIVEFIGGENSSIDTHCKLKEVNNQSHKGQIPHNITMIIAENLHEEMLSLSQNLGGFCKIWYDKYFPVS